MSETEGERRDFRFRRELEVTVSRVNEAVAKIDPKAPNHTLCSFPSQPVPFSRRPETLNEIDESICHSLLVGIKVSYHFHNPSDTVLIQD